MSYLQIDDGLIDHPKFVCAEKLAGSTALHLWFGLMTYCKRHLTDGRVPLDMLSRVPGPRLRWRRRALDALVTVGLIECTDDEMRVHDYLEWNLSRAEIESKSAARKHGRGRAPEDALASSLASSERRLSVALSVMSASSLASSERQHKQSDHVEMTSLGSEPGRARARKTETETETEYKIGSPPPPDDGGAAVKKKSRQRTPTAGKLRSRCPADLTPTAAELKLASKLGFSDQREQQTREEFIDYWLGEGTLKADWLATYRNRLRTVADRLGLKPIKRDRQWAEHQSQLRSADSPANEIAAPPPDFESKVSNLFG